MEVPLKCCHLQPLMMETVVSLEKALVVIWTVYCNP